MFDVVVLLVLSDEDELFDEFDDVFEFEEFEPVELEFVELFDVNVFVPFEDPDPSDLSDESDDDASRLSASSVPLVISLTVCVVTCSHTPSDPLLNTASTVHPFSRKRVRYSL